MLDDMQRNIFYIDIHAFIWMYSRKNKAQGQTCDFTDIVAYTVPNICAWID